MCLNLLEHIEYNFMLSLIHTLVHNRYTLFGKSHEDWALGVLNYSV